MANAQTEPTLDELDFAWVKASGVRSERECELQRNVRHALLVKNTWAEAELVRLNVRRDVGVENTESGWLAVYDFDEKWHTLRAEEIAAERVFRAALATAFTVGGPSVDPVPPVAPTDEADDTIHIDRCDCGKPSMHDGVCLYNRGGWGWGFNR